MARNVLFCSLILFLVGVSIPSYSFAQDVMVTEDVVVHDTTDISLQPAADISISELQALDTDGESAATIPLATADDTSLATASASRTSIDWHAFSLAVLVMMLVGWVVNRALFYNKNVPLDTY